MLPWCNRLIEFSFYSLFILVPLVFNANTSELFEFNKMWLTFGLTTLIAAAWSIKMVLQKRFHIQRTPLDIPILLFLASQIISTIFSLDSFVSWWGYYSRWNGGLLSTICYIFLYYAFVSNLSSKHVLRSLWVILASGIFVALWGFPSHFGADPTCLIFRGTFDTSCWTDAFKPTVRAFSTLGQPAWMAAFFAALLPLVTVLAIRKQKSAKTFMFYGLAAFFYLLLIFANTRAGFIGYFAADVVLFGLLFLKPILTRKVIFRSFIIFHSILFICSFFFGMPHASLNKFTFSEMTKKVTQPSSPPPATQPVTAQSKNAPTINTNITDSADIRKYVWEGAIKAWQANPIFGTGVETFAFAYYQHKPAGHNMTSEWDYLYNKAHNEYLNYLATTGIFGLGSYLFFICFFIFQFFKYLISKSQVSNHKQIQNTNNQNKKHFENLKLFGTWNFEFGILVIALFAGWISILITNFFGFSVVIINLYFFFFPAFIFILSDMLKPDKIIEIPKNVPQNTKYKIQNTSINPYQWTGIIVLFLTSCFLLLGLLRYWYTDIDYALGHNLDGVGAYQQAYPKLLQAVKSISNEPVYQDELAINMATLASALYMQKEAQTAAQLANNAVALSDQVTKEHPNNVVYWKNRVRIFYTLADADTKNQKSYYEESLRSINKAAELAPTDAKVSYNQGVLYGQTGNVEKAVEILTKTVQLKPNYRDAYYALGLFYRQLAVDKDNKLKDPAMNQKAIETYQYILDKISPNDKQVQDTLQEWQK